MSGLSGAEVAALAAIWILSMYAQSFVLTAALPGLTNGRAMLLNLTGSSVSNTLPLGGAVGVGLNYAMIRSWGFDRAAFGLYAVVTNVWDVAAKLALPALATAVLLLTGQARSPWLVTAALVSAAMLAVLVSLAVAAARGEEVARRLGTAAERAVNAVLPRIRPGRQLRLAEAAAGVQARGARLLGTAWPQLTLGIAAYVGVLFALLWSSLHVLGSDLGVTAVFAGFALERALTLLVLTPAGTGLPETASVALLVGTERHRPRAALDGAERGRWGALRRTDAGSSTPARSWGCSSWVCATRVAACPSAWVVSSGCDADAGAGVPRVRSWDGLQRRAPGRDGRAPGTVSGSSAPSAPHVDEVRQRPWRVSTGFPGRTGAQGRRAAASRGRAGGGHPR